MDKTLCDQLICAYTEKLYGFALTKTHSITHAEELAARITLEVYASLLRRSEILNVNAYIYRVAENVWVRYTDEYRNSSYCDISELQIADDHDFTEAVEQSETYAKLRVEIAHLSEVRRQILMMHYYNNMKLSDIAARLDIPVGTVKWHLSGARSELKEGMDKMRNIGKLGLEPIELVNMGHGGIPGTKGDTSDFLARRLTQNIAYAAYHKARTVNEIADELGVSPVFVADEVAVLEEYGFMDKVGDKYLTNIYITEPTKEYDEAKHALMCEYATKIRELYIPSVIDALRSIDRSQIYIPENDENLWMWSGISYMLSRLHPRADQKFDFNKFAVKRKDGGTYIAMAQVAANYAISYDERNYACCGSMARSSLKYRITSWQIGTNYDSRVLDYKANLTEDYDYLYEFMTGKITKTPEDIEKYERIRSKGYLTADDRVNIICLPSEDMLSGIIPLPNDALETFGRVYAQNNYELNQSIVAEHMRPLCKAYSGSIFSGSILMRVLEQLIADGTLKLPTPEQAGGLTTFLFTDVLPE